MWFLYGGAGDAAGVPWAAAGLASTTVTATAASAAAAADRRRRAMDLELASYSLVLQSIGACGVVVVCFVILW